jgi:hypothetical protein
MLTRGLIVAGVAGAVLALLTTAGRTRRGQVEKQMRKKELSRWEDEGGNLPPERKRDPVARADISNPA